jgi:hypothetical protein
MALGTANKDGFAAGWDWKSEYISSLNSGDGLERFSQGSLTPDTTILFAGPARFSAVSGASDRLHAMGLIDSFGYSSSATVQPLYEIGSNRTFFTRGKTQNQIQISSMVADHANLLKALMAEAYDEVSGKSKDSNYFLNTQGTKAPGAGSMALNLDSEAFNVPFGILMCFKTKGEENGNNLYGKIIGATYLENCVMTNFSLNVQAQSPIIQDSVGIMFDRAVPVSVG